MIEASPTPEALASAIDLLFRTSQVMVPVITGFIVLVSAIVGKLWESSSGLVEYRVIGAGVVLSVIALFCWLGVMPFCYKAALGYEQGVWGFGTYNSAALFEWGRRFARLGQITFGLAVIAASWFCLRVARRREKS